MRPSDSDRLMYRWRQLSDSERRQVLQHRRARRVPWHSPPHYPGETETYLITAACYEHKPIIGYSPDRMAEFEQELLEHSHQAAESMFAWVVLLNHYHMLLRATNVKRLLKTLGQLHGRTSFRWNSEEACRGRQVWFNAAETGIRSDRHYFASLNYVLNNAVHHGYVKQYRIGHTPTLRRISSALGEPKRSAAGATIRYSITARNGIRRNYSRRLESRL